MRLTMKERKVVTKVVSLRYRTARKKLKNQILNEFIQTTGYSRCYACWLLRNYAVRKKCKPKTVRGGRRRYYGPETYSPLRKIWEIMDYICGKRLKPALPELIAKLEEHGELYIDDRVKAKLLKISPATIDRLLGGDRKTFQLKGRSNTKPGSLLKHQIPIRTFAQWDEDKPGFTEIDLVGHEGGNPRGDYIQTLDATDIKSCWTETEAVKNKAQVYVFAGLKAIEKRLPFKLLGIDSDNGSEFINGHLLNFCTENKITFTRGRSSKKNDNCYVEQKNYSVVRRAVGYARYDTDRELKLLNELYRHLRLYTNYFQPVMKLEEKRWEGSRVYKKYDVAQTPYTRLMNCAELGQKYKDAMKQEYAKLNPAQLKRDITRLQNKLLEIGLRKRKVNTQKRVESGGFA